MRVAAAETPMTTAKMGSATREMMYVGAGMVAEALVTVSANAREKKAELHISRNSRLHPRPEGKPKRLATRDADD